jgi:hypothetical protein
MKHCQPISVRKAEVDPDDQAWQDFLEVTVFRVAVALVAAFKAVF